MVSDSVYVREEVLSIQAIAQVAEEKGKDVRTVNRVTKKSASCVNALVIENTPT